MTSISIFLFQESRKCRKSSKGYNFGHGEVKLVYNIEMSNTKVFPLISYVVFIGIQKVIVVVMKVLWGHIFGHGEVKWPPICLKHRKVEYCSHYLSFDMSHDMGYEKVIVVVMKVICGYIFGHGVVKWPPICLNIKRSNTDVITFHLICHLTWDTKKSLLWSWRSFEVTYFGHVEVKWPLICLKHWIQVITFHLICHMTWDKKKSLLW